MEILCVHSTGTVSVSHSTGLRKTLPWIPNYVGVSEKAIAFFRVSPHPHQV